LKNNIYNLGLSSANLSKISLAKKIKTLIKKLRIVTIKNASDPDKRDYYVSNKKIEKAGFKPSVTLEEGIKELINVFTFAKVVFKNNY
jgi:nucleoside-diphosphate-sugar epimerase